MCLQDLWITQQSLVSVIDKQFSPGIVEIVPYNNNRIFLAFYRVSGAGSVQSFYPKQMETGDGDVGWFPSVDNGNVGPGLWWPYEVNWLAQIADDTVVIRVIERIISKPLEQLIAEYQNKYGR